MTPDVVLPGHLGMNVCQLGMNESTPNHDNSESILYLFSLLMTLISIRLE